MFDIKELIKKLSICNKIDFTGKESEFELLAQKYDKDQNSVFEEDEISEIKDDLILNAKKDGNKDEFSDEEVNDYYKSFLHKENSLIKFIKRIGRTVLPENGSIRRHYRERQREKNVSKFEEMTNELINTGEQNKKDLINKKIKETNDRITLFESCYDSLDASLRKELRMLNSIVYRLQDDELLKFKTTDLERLIDLLYIHERGEKQFSKYDLKTLARLNDEELERAKKYLFHAYGREKEFSSFEIEILAKLSDEELERARFYLFNAEGRKEQFNSSEIAELAKLSDEELKRARFYLFNAEGRKEQFNSSEIAELAKLSDEELYWAMDNLFNVNEREEQFNGYAIAQLAKLENKDLIKKYLARDSFTAFGLTCIANNYSNVLAEYIDTHPELIGTEYSTDDYVKFYDYNNGVKRYCYDKTGLFETEDFDSINDFDKIKDCYKKTYINKKLNVKHEVIGGKYGKAPDYIIVSETFTYYDNKGKVIKTVIMKINPESGFINVSETDINGKQTPIQWETVDPDTGAKITERHLNSPDGTKTEFYAEESDNLRITDYKITDKDGNSLINVHQTFEQVSANKFISSINTNDNHKNTQIYEMEYTVDNVVRIYDKKNDETTEIDLKQYYENEESIEKLMPFIKQLPGHILLEFAEKPLFKIKYDLDPDCEENGYWNSKKRTLAVGNHDKTTSAEENMFAALVHELGHYLDLYNDDDGIFSQNPEIIQIYKEEFEEFKKSTTTAQHEDINYFTDVISDKRGHREKVAETHAILNSINHPQLNLRRLYLAQYFPRTMAAIMKLLLEEEGVEVKG